MAETPKEFVPKTIADLIPPVEGEDPNTPFYKKFYDLPVMQKMELLFTLGKNDPDWQKMSDSQRLGFIKQHKLILPEEAPQAVNTGQTLTTPSTPETVEGSLPSVIGRGVVKGLDLIPSMVTKPVGAALEMYGRAPELLGLQQPGEQNVFTRAGSALQNPGFSEPLETIATAGEGYKPLREPGYAALEHVITSATGAAATTPVIAGFMPLLRAGYELPLAEQVRKAALLAGQGATLAEVAKATGLGPWTQFVTELVGGLATVPDAIKMFKAVAQVPGLRSYLRSTTSEQQALTKKTTEAFGGPSFEEQMTGGAEDVLQGQKQRLESFVSGEGEKVKAAETLAEQAGGRSKAIEGQTHLMDLDFKGRVQAAQDTAATQVAQIKQNMQQVDDQITRTRTDMSAEARQRRQELTMARHDLEDQYRGAIRQAQDAQKSVQADVQASQKNWQAQTQALQDDLSLATTANQRDMQQALEQARANTRAIAPAMAEAGGEAEAVGSAAIRKTGESGTQFYEAVTDRLKNNAKRVYGQIYRDSQIEEPARDLLQTVNKYRPTLAEESIPTAQYTGTYAPKSAVQSLDDKLVQKIGGADELHKFVEANSHLTPEQLRQRIEDFKGSMKLTLEDIHDFRSRLLDDQRHTPYGSQRRRQLGDLIGEVDAYVDMLAEHYPKDVARLRMANAWYRQEKLRLTGEPGQLSTIKSPVTGEPLHTPDEIARSYFGVGPTVADSSANKAGRQLAFNTYLSDIHDVMTDAALHGDTKTYAAATNAKESLFDMVRVQFYDAAMEEGNYNAKKAAAWMKDHGALLRDNAELSQLFAEPRARAEAVRSVEAKAQALATYTENLNADLQEANRAGTLARQERTAQAAADLETARGTATDVRAAGARGLSERRGQLVQDIARVQEQTAAERVAAARAREEQIRLAEEIPAREERRQSEQMALQKERIRIAEDAQAEMEANKKQVAEEFERAFPGRAAARAGQDAYAEHKLGSNVDAIVQQIDAMGSQADKNAAWGQWMKRAGDDPDLKRAILQARWRNEMGTDSVISLGDAKQFIADNKEWLQTYYPGYMTKIERVQRAIEKMEQLYKDKPLDFTKRSLFRHAGISGTLVYMSHIFGLNWSAAVGLGLGSEAIQHELFHRRIAMLSQAYLDPHDLDVLYRALQPRAPINTVNQAAWSILTRAGALGKAWTEAEE